MCIVEHLPGIELDGSDVEPARVVGVDGAGHVLRSSVRMQVTSGGKDGVAWIVDVAAAVAGPGRRHELHRPLRAGGAETLDPAHVCLDQVDGGQILPLDSGALLRLTVV